MNAREANLIRPGTRVRHRPTGEEGTVVRTELQAHAFTPSRLDEIVSKTVSIVVIKHDEPAWLPAINYYRGNHFGRKFKDLEVIRSITSRRRTNTNRHRGGSDAEALREE